MGGQQGRPLLQWHKVNGIGVPMAVLDDYRAGNPPRRPAPLRVCGLYTRAQCIGFLVPAQVLAQGKGGLAMEPHNPRSVLGGCGDKTNQR